VLYGIEKEAQGQPPEARVAIRQEKAKPLVDDLEDWLGAQLPKASGKSELAKAICNALSRLPKTAAISRPWLSGDRQ
jgi:transposase